MNSALLTDILDRDVFAFFRNYPFEERYSVFCGLHECLKYVKKFSFRDEDIEFLKERYDWEAEFFTFLQRDLNELEVEIEAQDEGQLVTPFCPLRISPVFVNFSSPRF